MRDRYFFDAYALLRLFEDAPSARPYANVPIFTDQGCMYEFAREVLRRTSARVVRTALAELRTERLVATEDDLVEASKFLQRAPRISAQDALAYTLAQRNGLLFLTGDGAFRRLPGVEFLE